DPLALQNGVALQFADPMAVALLAGEQRPAGGVNGRAEPGRTDGRSAIEWRGGGRRQSLHGKSLSTAVVARQATACAEFNAVEMVAARASPSDPTHLAEPDDRVVQGLLHRPRPQAQLGQAAGCVEVHG